MIILNRWYLNVNLLNSLTKYDCVSMDRELGPYCHRNFPPRERWGSRIVDFSRVDWAGAAAILLKSGQRMLLF
jgi:hypothetical protein